MSLLNFLEVIFLKKRKRFGFLKNILAFTFLLIFLFSIKVSGNNNNKIKVAGDKNFPPYEFLDTGGTFKGFNVDIMNTISIYTGLEVEYLPMEWSEAVKALEEGSVDAVLGMAKSPGREKKFDFSIPILVNSRVLFTKRDNTKINSLNDLIGKKVALQKGDIAEEIIKNIEDVDVIREKTQHEALMDLIESKADAFIGNKYAGLYFVKENNLEKLVKIVNGPLSESDYCIAVKKGNYKLLGLINSGLERMKKDGVYIKIYEKWFGEEFVDVKSIIKRYLSIGLGAVFILIAALVLLVAANRKLNKMVAIKTKELIRANEELTATYEEISAQNEELIANFEELRASEQKIRELQERLMLALDASGTSVWEYNLKEKKFYITENIQAIIKNFKENNGYKSILRSIEKKDRKNLFEKIRQAYKGKIENIEVKVRVKSCGENKKYLLIQGKLIDDKITGVISDITELESYREKLEYMSLHDNLTGLYNRAFFEEELKRYAGSRDYPISIIMIDLNGLKLINDSLGHDKGDKLLRTCAEVLLRSIRTSDILARIGGDEFALLLPRTFYSDAEKIVKRIMENVEKYNATEAQDGLYLSLAIGYATAESDNIDLKDVMKKADELMYRDKLIKSTSIRSQTLNVLLSALAEKDCIIEGHTKRVKELCLKMGQKLGLPPKELSDLSIFAEVHDLGEVAISDSILNKKGPLTDEEWEIIKKHSEKGYRIALSSPDLAGIADLILKHHERWDGKGYPLGLKGKEIPLLCRILSVADAFDAMTSKRPYNMVKSVEEALSEIKRNAGTQFDPEIVEVFLSLFDKNQPRK